MITALFIALNWLLAQGTDLCLACDRLGRLFVQLMAGALAQPCRSSRRAPTAWHRGRTFPHQVRCVPLPDPNPGSWPGTTFHQTDQKLIFLPVFYTAPHLEKSQLVP